MSNSKILANVASNLANNSGKILSVANSEIFWSENYAWNAANNANAEIAILKGVNTSQNTFSQSAFIHANAAFDIANTKFNSSGGTVSGDVTITGNVTVQGTTTTINADTLIIKDKNIVLANVISSSNTTADGAGITVLGTTNKTWNWSNANSSWTSSENIDLASGKSFKIAGNDVLSGSSLGSGITASSLTSVGTLSSLTVSGNVTLGDANTDTLTINGTAVSIPNNLNFDSNTLFIDAANNRVGIGTDTPAAQLDIKSGSQTSFQFYCDVTSPLTGFTRCAVLRVKESLYTETASGAGYFTHEGDGSVCIGNTRNSSSYGILRFFSTPNSGTPLERLRIDSVGTLLLRQSSDAANTSVSFNTTVQNALTLDSSGRLGIGTASFSDKLHVEGSLKATGNVTLGDASGDTVALQAGTAALPTLIPAGDPNTGLWFPAADTVAWSTAGTERLRINDIGRVILNHTAQLSTSTGSAPILQVISKVAAVGTLFMQHCATAGGCAIFGTKTRTNTPGDYTSAVTLDDVLLFFGAEGADGVSSLRRGANISLNAAGTFSPTSSPAYIRFDTTPSGSVTAVERLRIDSSGNLFLYQSSNSANTSVSFNTTVQNALTLDSSGNLGIGTSSPVRPLHVVGTGSFTDGVRNTVTNGIFTVFGGTEYNTGGGVYLYGSTHATEPNVVKFTTAGTTKLLINESGNVGIGTSSPINSLEVIGNNVSGISGGDAITVTSNTTTNNGFDATPGISFRGPANTTASRYVYSRIQGGKLTTGSGVLTGYLSLSATVSSDLGVLERVRITPTGFDIRQSSNAANTSVSFNTTIQNAMTLDASGDLGIGTASPSYKLDVNGSASVSGQLVVTDAWDAVNGGGSIYLNGANNRIEWNSSGVNPPSTITRSSGAKLVLYPSIGSTSTDYALGIDAGTLWNSVPGSTQQFKWYASNTNIMTLSGTGALSASSFNPTSSTVPIAGVYLSAANTIAFSTASTIAASIDSTNNFLSKGSIKSDSATAGVGYTTGAGGTVTQLTSKTTGVTLNKTCGIITSNNASLAANTAVSFTLTNSAVAATDVLILNHVGGGTAGNYMVNGNCGAGSAVITMRNLTGGALSDAVQIRFAVIKGVEA